MGIAGDAEKLSANIMASYDARIKTIGTIIDETQTLAKNTHTMLNGFHAERQEMSAAQSKALAGFMADLTNNIAGLLKKTQKEQGAKAAARKQSAAALKVSLAKANKNLETSVKAKLQEFSSAHADMSATLKGDLTKYVSNIVKEIQGLLGSFNGERGQMADYWQAMSAALAKKRGFEPVGVEAADDVKTVAEAVKKPAARKGRPKGKGKKK